TPSPRGASVELRVAAGAGQGEPPPLDAGPVPGSWTPGTVPALAGLPLADATDLAQRAGYEVVVLRVPGRPLGLVLAQDVAAGKAAPAGSPIGVRVAAGGEGPTVSAPAPVPSAVAEVTVPGVLDRTAAQARRVLEDAGLTVREEQAESGVSGRVMDQRPAAGERVKKGAEVAIFVPRSAAETPAAPAAPESAPAAPPPADLGSPDGPMGSPDGPPTPPSRLPAAPPAATPPPSSPPPPSVPEPAAPPAAPPPPTPEPAPAAAPEVPPASPPSVPSIPSPPSTPAPLAPPASPEPVPAPVAPALPT